MDRLIIFPYNGNGREALDCIQGQYDFIGFADDDVDKQREGIDYNVYPRSIFNDYPDAYILAVPGSPISYNIRKKIIESLNINPFRFATLIHPKATVSNSVNIGFNVLVMAGVVITADAHVGNHVCVLPNSVIHHDSFIGEYTLIGSNVTIAGFSKIGSHCYIGSGSSIINNIEIGDKTLVGMGTNVIKSIPKNSKVVGNPSRLI